MSLNKKSPCQRVKTEREFVISVVKTGLIVLAVALVIAVSVTWYTTRNYETWIHVQAVKTAVVLPLVMVPACILVIGWQNLKDHRNMLEITRLALTDEMTGLANRRSFMHEAASRLADVNFDAEGICAYIIDLDHFKRVNDQFGHSAGDATLIHVAKVMEAALPVSALIARLGGEEFAVLVRFESLEDIHEQAEALRAAVANTPCLTQGDTIECTVSVGIGIAAPEDTVPSLLSRADCALYEAKSEGRNRFAIAA